MAKQWPYHYPSCERGLRPLVAQFRGIFLLAQTEGRLGEWLAASAFPLTVPSPGVLADLQYTHHPVVLVVQDMAVKHPDAGIVLVLDDEPY